LKIWDTVSSCSDPDTSKRIDERNLSPPKKTILVPSDKIILKPATVEYNSGRAAKQFGGQLKYFESRNQNNSKWDDGDRSDFEYNNKYLRVALSERNNFECRYSD